MSPRAYIAAREAATAADETHYVMVDDQPYFPNLRANGADHSTIRRVVKEILSVSSSSSSLLPSTNGRNDVEWPVTVVSGGITNQLYRVEITGDGTVSILLRIFGAEGMIDRDVENATFAALSAQQLAPPYYGRFANGRLEGWLNGMKPLTPRDMARPDIGVKIAHEMALLHAKFVTPEALLEYHNPQQPSLWTQLKDWMDQAIAAKFCNDAETQRAHEMVTPLLKDLPAEFDWLQKDVVPGSLPVAFCHNDVLGANVLYNSETGVLKLVDFEYGGVNYKAFDIANHFNEYAGGSTENGVTNYDWFPTKEHQCAFLKAYLETAATCNGSDATLEVSEEEIQTWYNQVQGFILVNHLYWGTWAVNQASTEGCDDFDYLLFGHNRLSRYFDCKKEAYPDKVAS